MTVAVAAKYPWGSLNKLPSPVSKIPEAIILASDSRLSYKQGAEHVPKWDIGTKVFQLGNDVAIIYAGTSKIGEESIDKLRWKLARGQTPSAVDKKIIAQKVLRVVYMHNLALMKLKPDEAPVYFLIDACSKSG